MCQLVATMMHLFLCRYECQNFGFWGLFLAGRFCVYITQMNFLFCPFFYLILSYLIPICYASILPLFCSFCLVLSCLVLPLFVVFLFFFLFCSFVPYSFALLLCLWVKCRFVVNVPRYHVATLPR